MPSCADSAGPYYWGIRRSIGCSFVSWAVPFSRSEVDPNIHYCHRVNRPSILPVAVKVPGNVALGEMILLGRFG